jgi:predicted ATP-dependent serine protease
MIKEDRNIKLKCYVWSRAAACIDDDFPFSVFSSQQQVTYSRMTSPVLGSTLLRIVDEKSQSRKRKRVGMSFDAIDSALQGGVDYGAISCISGDKSQGKTTVWFLCSNSIHLACLAAFCPNYSSYILHHF